MQLLVWVLWGIHKGCFVLSDMLVKMAFGLIGRIDRLDRHFADKRWAKRK